MPISNGKPIIDIDINDAKFKNFAESFHKYHEALKSMPGDWKNVGDASSEASSNFQTMLASMMAQHELARDIAKTEMDAAEAAEKRRKEQQASERSGAMHWRDMARTTRDVANNLFAATTALLKWSLVTTAVSGLLGAGGLWGIDRLAVSTATGQRTSRGLGVSFGEQKAFGVNFGQLVDTDAFLGNVNTATSSYQGRADLIRTGLTPNQMSGSTADVGIALINRMKALADRTDKSQLSNMLQVNGLDKFFSLSEANQIKAASSKEIAGYESRYTVDASRMNVPEAHQQAMVDFAQQMDRAWNDIKTTFVEGLVRFAPTLTRMSQSVVTIIDNIAKSPVVNHWLDELAKGMQHLADYIGSPKFETAVKSFVDDIDAMARGLGKLRKFAGWIFEGYSDVGQAVSWAVRSPDSGIVNNYAMPTREGGIGHLNTLFDWADSALDSNYKKPRYGAGFSEFSLGSSVKSAGESLFDDTLIGSIFRLSDVLAVKGLAWMRSGQAGSDVGAYFTGATNAMASDGVGGIADAIRKSTQNSRVIIQVHNGAGANINTSTSQIYPAFAQ